jgi:predicted nucleotidyltransferase
VKDQLRCGFRPEVSCRVGPCAHGLPTYAHRIVNDCERHRDEIIELVHQHRARSIAVFGSVARGEATSDSDIDFLVEFDPSSSLLDLIHLEEALSELLGVSVDVISAAALLERDTEIRRDAIAL